MKDSLPFESLAGYLQESSVGQEKKAIFWKIIEIFLKITSFTSLKTKQIATLNSFYELKDNPLSLSIGVSQFK